MESQHAHKNPRMGDFLAVQAPKDRSAQFAGAHSPSFDDARLLVVCVAIVLGALDGALLLV